MGKREFLFYLGVFLIFFGLIIIPFSVTGLVVAESSANFIGWSLGLTFVLAGIIILSVATRTRSGLEEVTESDAGVHIEVTKDFVKDIKRLGNADLKLINNAVHKIGTGTGGEHRLHGPLEGHYSISTSKGGRVLFDYDSTHQTATLIGYTGSHDYNKFKRAG